MAAILVTGGAGYVGSCVCKSLARAGYTPVVLDNLVAGHRAAVRWGRFFQGHIDDGALLKEIFTSFDIAAVMHFAAFCYVGDSVKEPARYYRNNVAATLALLTAMVESGVSNFIFSSSCAVYGNPGEIPISETHPTCPVNPYGRTKLMVEMMLRDLSEANGLHAVSLRYFNAAGADPEGELGEDHRPETHLIPLVLQVALGKRPHIEIYGDDYPTKDGTCVRDYIHIDDLARAHILALERLLDGSAGGAYNLGNGTGYSVREVIETARRVTGRPIVEKVSQRRAGDPPVLVSAGKKAAAELNWSARFTSLDAIVETAWRWHMRHPDGYGSDSS